MNLKKIRRYFSFKFLLYIFGRFKIIRYLYKLKNKINSKYINIEKNNENHIELNFDERYIIKKIETDSFYDGLKLKKDTIENIINLSKKSDLITTTDNTKFSTFDEINEFNKNNNKPYCLINVVNPDLKVLIDKISRNKNLLDIANNYLGKVNNIDTKVQWSPVCNTSDDWREHNEQTVTFHYDVHHLNFLYVFFYITDCNKDSGAHELIKGSHTNKKFFKHLIGSVKQTSDSLELDYDIKKFIKLEGNAGYGFVEDTSCYHRARIPLNNPRLALQIRYY